MHITYDMVREDLPRIIDIKGRDYTYMAPGGDTCLYVYNDKPSCLIGHYLVDLGYPLDGFVEGKDIQDFFLDGHAEKQGFTAEDDAVYAMLRVQQYQDEGFPWGTAYDNTFED